MNQSYFNRQEAVSSAAQSAPVSLAAPAESEPQRFAISTYNNEFDNVPKPRNWTWPEFCQRLGKHLSRSKKSGNPMWSAAQYYPEAKRCKAGVELITMAVLDIDSGTPVDQVIAQIKGYAYLIHSTYSHTDEYPKYRVILPLVEPSEAEQWPMHWARINHWFGNINDPAVKDQSRGYFIPCRPVGGAHFTKIGEGRYFDINELPELPAELVPSTAKYSPRTPARIKIEGIEEAPPDLNPAIGLVEIVNRCSFMQWASDPQNQDQVSEPLWMAMISNACFCEDSEAWIHQASCEHSGYDEAATDRRIERVRTNYAPFTCQRIREHGFTQCPSGGCRLHSGLATKAPAGLWTWIRHLPITLPFGGQQGGN